MQASNLALPEPEDCTPEDAAPKPEAVPKLKPALVELEEAPKAGVPPPNAPALAPPTKVSSEIFKSSVKANMR